MNEENIDDAYRERWKKERTKVFELESKLAIAVEALEKLVNDKSPPWDNLAWKRVAREALEKINNLANLPGEPIK